MAKSLATRHQFYMYLNYRKDSVLAHECPQPISGSEIPVSLLQGFIQDKIKVITNGNVEVVYQAKGVIFEGQKYANNTGIALEFGHDNIQFGKVESVIFIADVPYLVYRKLDTVGFNVHYNSYEVLRTEIIDICQISELLDYHPLGIYNVFGVDCDVIPLKYKISTQ